jgi:antitoxin ParD1/3/4
LIEKLVDSGRYQNASEVLREGLRLVENREKEDRARLQALREAARAGIEDLESGRYTEFGSFDELTSHLNKLANATLAKRGTPRGRK